jgi:beta-N-acetylhexosaminidase
MAPTGVLRRAGVGSLATIVILSGCTASPHPVPTPLAAEPPVSAAVLVDPIQAYADARLEAMTLDQKIASMLLVHLAGLDAAALGQYAAANGVGGLILMGDNIPDPSSQLATMTPLMSTEYGLPILIATDQEGGIVARVPTDDAPAADQLRNLPPDAARDAFHGRGALLKSLGITLNFGVVADVTGDPDSFIFERTMGSTPADAAPRVAAAVTGESGEVLSTLKHFPGHGVSPVDSHSSIPETAISMQDWRTNHAPPFTAGIEAGAEAVMFGHLQFDAVDPQPASLSALWHQVLRNELGFTGITITDDMNMLEYSGRADLADQRQNAVRAVAAGNTMLLYVGAVDIPGVVAAVHAAVDDGTIPLTTIDDAAHRMLVLRRALSGQMGAYVRCNDKCQAGMQ